MEHVIVYSNGCPQCKVLEAKLKQKGVTYEEVNDVDLMLSKGFRSMPMMEVEGINMTYAEALKWINN